MDFIQKLEQKEKNLKKYIQELEQIERNNQVVKYKAPKRKKVLRIIMQTQRPIFIVEIV
jgi:hypothetical protein